MTLATATPTTIPLSIMAVPEAGIAIMLKGIVGVAVAKVMELHELVGRCLDEERSHHIDKSINHLVPITKLIVGEESVVDEFIDDPAVIFETKRLKEGGREEVSQEMLVRHHRVWNQVGVVDHSENKRPFVFVGAKDCPLWLCRGIANVVHQVLSWVLVNELLRSVGLGAWN